MKRRVRQYYPDKRRICPFCKKLVPPMQGVSFIKAARERIAHKECWEKQKGDKRR